MPATIEQLTEIAECAFWRAIADAVPADSGDVDPIVTHRFRAAAKAAVDDWLASNAEHDVCCDCGEQHPAILMRVTEEETGTSALCAACETNHKEQR